MSVTRCCCAYAELGFVPMRFDIIRVLSGIAPS